MSIIKKSAEKLVAQVAYKTAAQGANSSCSFFFFQPQVPEQVKKLRKF